MPEKITVLDLLTPFPETLNGYLTEFPLLDGYLHIIYSVDDDSDVYYEYKSVRYETIDSIYRIIYREEKINDILNEKSDGK